MVRFVLKGGVWRNTEDEVLKAAVMKYGLNQWARISSLLTHKTAKQCKARWHEWLDPAIRKTEWTRDEEEKLLHLAKLMPTQWRTIAPIVGRTPTQCLEHYNRLLDAAASASSASDAAAAASADPRRLRPGEIDPLPEAKPARPDPVDMDEDEKEMLSEARARLANTRGKKAKRKAREKQLDEARRLAALQKQRELRAAGINVHVRSRPSSGSSLDYNAEIPFHRTAPPGAHPVPPEELRTREEEAVAAALRAGRVPREVLEQPQPGRKAEQLDAKRRRQEKPTAEAEARLAAEVLRETKAAEAAAERMRRKAKLVLPAPQVTEREIEELARMRAESAEFEAQVATAKGRPTGALLARYGGATPAMTPAAQLQLQMRTPARTPATRDTLLQEAQNLARLTEAPTPLHGGENVPLQAASTKRREAVPRTPNVLLATTSRAAATPMRDGLSINERQQAAAAVGPSAEKARRAAQRKEFEALLGALPAPKFRYRVALPEAKKQQQQRAAEDADDELPEDAADADAREERARKRAEEELLQRCSGAMRRGLPRATRPDAYPVRAATAEMLEVEKLVSEEFSRLVLFELRNFPCDTAAALGSVPPAGEGADEVTADMIGMAERLVAEEEEKGAAHVDAAQFSEEWDRCWADLVWLPSGRRWVRKSKAAHAEVLEAARAQFAVARQRLDRETLAASRLDRRVALYMGGYQQRALALRRGAEEAHAELERINLELQCFEALLAKERKAATTRAEELRHAIADQQAAESKLQQRYAQLRDALAKKQKQQQS